MSYRSYLPLNLSPDTRPKNRGNVLNDCENKIINHHLFLKSLFSLLYEIILRPWQAGVLKNGNYTTKKAAISNIVALKKQNIYIKEEGTKSPRYRQKQKSF